MSKNILFISTIHRMSERLLPAISYLHEVGEKICILNLGQSSKNTDYESNKRYHDKLEKFDKVIKIYNGAGINNKRDVRNESFCKSSVKLIFDVCRDHKIDTVILDDSRQSLLNLYIGTFCKKNKIFLFANAHGVTDEPEVTFSLKEPFYDKLLVFGRQESEKFNKKYKNDLCIPVGIPENDCIKSVKTSQEQITVIVNRVVIDVPLSPGERMYDDLTLKDMCLVELQQRLKVPVVFKVKDRMSDDTQRDIDAIKNYVSKDLNFRIETHIEDEIDFLAKSKIVLSYGSGMNFKPMQMLIPTIVFKGLGTVGVFKDYKGTVEIGDDYFNVLDSLTENDIRNFLRDNLEGSLDFNSVEKYCKAILS